MSGHPERAVYRVNEVAVMLDISRGGAYAGLRSGEIPAIRLGSRWIIPKQMFDSWLSTRRTNGGDL